MNKENNSDAIDKLDDINCKIGAIVAVFSFLDVNNAVFGDEDVAGFNMILRDLQDNVNEIKELLS